jgi:regulator of sirC expression with transglutaminase-like and TPR domain
MEIPERFAAAVDVPPDEVRLDVAAFCIAACAHAHLDVDDACRGLDALAAQCPGNNFAAVREFLFVAIGFTGNVDDYGDPENSMLDSVLERRVGIPITLSVLTMEVGRRCGVDIVGVGMPGHFLVKERGAEHVWCDPFHGGVLLDMAGCQELFERAHGGGGGFHPSYLASTSSHAIVARMLANLEQGPLSADPANLAWMLQLHLSIPELGSQQRSHLQQRLRAVRARWN